MSETMKACRGKIPLTLVVLVGPVGRSRSVEIRNVSGKLHWKTHTARYSLGGNRYRHLERFDTGVFGQYVFIQVR